MLEWLFRRGERLLVDACMAVASRVPNRTFYVEGNAYLTRFYILRRTRPEDLEGMVGPFSLYLHYFHRGDDDPELHDHPWKYSASLILTNGYVEERWDGKKIVTRRLSPGSLNFIRSTDFHRVDLINSHKGTWTLFFAGPRVQDWGFWHPTLLPTYIPQEQFLANREQKRHVPIIEA